MNKPALSVSLLAVVAAAAVATALAATALAATAVHAQTVITFNDLGASTGSTAGTHMPSSYAGFRWTTTDWYYMTNPAAPGNTFLALGGTGTFILSQTGADFYFDGADFWSRRGLDAAGRFYFVLYKDGATVYNGMNDKKGRQVFTGVPTRFTPNYTGPVDGIAIVFTQGGRDWNHLAMDNLRIRPIATVPTLSLAPIAAAEDRSPMTTLMSFASATFMGLTPNATEAGLFQ